jgi:hypothetical protein
LARAVGDARLLKSALYEYMGVAEQVENQNFAGRIDTANLVGSLVDLDQVLNRRLASREIYRPR